MRSKSAAEPRMTYATIHIFLERSMPGHAPCLCGRPSEEWALRKDAESVLTDSANGLDFSPYAADYMRMCRKCHRVADGNMKKAWKSHYAVKLAACPRGEAHYSTRLTNRDVEEIIQRRATGEVIRTIAADKGVSRATVCRIAKRRGWIRNAGSAEATVEIVVAK